MVWTPFLLFQHTRSFQCFGNVLSLKMEIYPLTSEPVREYIYTGLVLIFLWGEKPNRIISYKTKPNQTKPNPTLPNYSEQTQI